MFEQITNLSKRIVICLNKFLICLNKLGYYLFVGYIAYSEKVLFRMFSAGLDP